MEHTRQCLLQAVLDSPDNDAPRLIYADWLDERGEPERAEFIRIQCELAAPILVAKEDLLSETHPGEASAKAAVRVRPKRDELLRRERQLLESFGPAGNNVWYWMGSAHRLVPDGASWDMHVEFRRGFVRAVTCTEKACLQHIDAIRKESPLRSVTLTTWPAGGHWFKRVCGTMRLLAETGGDSSIKSILEATWPGVSFHLPYPTIIADFD